MYADMQINILHLWLLRKSSIAILVLNTSEPPQIQRTDVT